MGALFATDLLTVNSEPAGWLQEEAGWDGPKLGRLLFSLSFFLDRPVTSLYPVVYSVLHMVKNGSESSLQAELER